MPSRVSAPFATDDPWSALEHKLLSDDRMRPSPNVCQRQGSSAHHDMEEDVFVIGSGSSGLVVQSSVPQVGYFTVCDLCTLAASIRRSLPRRSSCTQLCMRRNNTSILGLQAHGSRSSLAAPAAAAHVQGGWSDGALAQKGSLMAGHFDVAKELEALLDTVEVLPEPALPVRSKLQGFVLDADADLEIDDIDDLDVELETGGKQMNKELQAQLDAFEAQWSASDDDLQA